MDDLKSLDRPVAVVVRAAGTNCDAELCRAFELAGARVELVHIGRVIADRGVLDGADLIGLPGGFSYGDDVAAGRAMSVLVERHLRGGLDAAVDRGVPIIGICNGFQVLVQTGMLPGGELGRCLALDRNTSGRFVDRWVGMRVSHGGGNVWTRSLPEDGFELPMAHGEGRLVVGGGVGVDELCADRSVLRYTEDVNGSVDGIAGIGDGGGLVYGLMPHPERYVDVLHHPTRSGVEVGGETAGLAFFRSAVEHVVGAEV